MIRLVWIYGVAVASTIFFGGTVAVRSALGIRRFAEFAERATAGWASLILWGARVNVVVRHAGRLGEGRGQILVSNHQSWFDVFSLAAGLPVRFSFVGKKELSRIPFLGHAWEKVGHVAIDRSDHQSALTSLQSVDGQVRGGGRTIIMFPEGTRSPTGELTRFKKGAFVMAIKAQVPVVPVAVFGSRRVMEKGSWKISPGTVTIRVGHPIETTGLTLRDRDRLSKQTHAAIAVLRNGGADGGDQRDDEGSADPIAPSRVELARDAHMPTEATIACRQS